MNKTRTGQDVLADIEQVTELQGSLRAERSQIIDSMAANLAGDNQAAENRVAVIAAKQEAADRRLNQLQEELKLVSKQEEWAEWEQLYKSANAHYRKLKAIDEDVAKLQTKIRDLQQQHRELDEEYQHSDGARRIALYRKIGATGGAEFAEFDGKLYQKYKVEGYL